MKAKKWEGTQVTATIGQYSDFINFSDLAFDFSIGSSCYCCGQQASWSSGLGAIRPDGTKPDLCDGCHFRHTVMKAAGREQEFWDAAEKSEYNQTVGSVAREMSYRMAASVDAMVRVTVDSGLSGK